MLEILEKQMTQGDALRRETGQLLMDMAERHPEWAEKVDAQLKKKTEEAKKQKQRIDELKKQLAAVNGSEEKA